MTDTSLIRPAILTAKQFTALANIPPEAEWFANIRSANTRAAYTRDVRDFLQFLGLRLPEDLDGLRAVRRGHILAWRKDLEKRCAAASIRRKLSAVSSLFEYLCDQNAIESNPVKGVARPREHSNEGLTPAISSGQARLLLDAPAPDTLVGIRDRAMLAILLHEALRVSELCGLRVKDYTERRGYRVFRFAGKGEKVRFVEVHPETQERIAAYLDRAGHGEDRNGPLFRPVRNNATKVTDKHVDRRTAWSMVRRYAKKVGIRMEGFCPHSLRATAITQALEGGSELSRVQAWAGHSSPVTTKMYDKRHLKPEQSPTFNTNY